MEIMEAKKINGKTYYYYSSWKRINGKPRREWQKYLGKLEDIAKAVEGGGPSPDYAEIFQWGLPLALWQEVSHADIISKIDALCPKRDQGLSIGGYITIAAINRAIKPKSKRSMWKWFSDTVLLRLMPNAEKDTLSSQNFWNHMDMIDSEKVSDIWKSILEDVIHREKIDLSSISYDGTNYYTFIDTFNTRCQIAKRGKNKQGRKDLRQVSYALFCSSDNHVPLFFDSYEGNRHDSKQFPLMLQGFHDFFKKTFRTKKIPDVTLIFDKGNNKKDNFKMLDKDEIHFIGSLKLSEVKDLVKIPNDSSRFTPCENENLEGTKVIRVKKKKYGKMRTVLVTYNVNLWNTQWKTVQNEIDKATEELEEYKQKLDDRFNGIVNKGKKPTMKTAKAKCKSILKRPYLKGIIKIKFTESSQKIPRLRYSVDIKALNKYANTYLGKNIIITTRKKWDNDRIIVGYRSQYIIEDVFKESKDRERGCWWPMNHYTDSKIKVHALYCSLTLLIRALMLRRVKAVGMNISMKRLLTELDGIREVINIYKAKGRQKNDRRQTTFSKLSDTQKNLISILELKKANVEI